MPQASDELQNEMLRLFGSAVEETGPMNFLTEKGYELTRTWFWKPPPHVKTYDDMAQDEWFCLKFLIDEWDVGGLWIEPVDPNTD